MYRKRRQSRVYRVLAQCMWLQEQLEPANGSDSGHARDADSLTIHI